jgi:hypothetical protein
MQSLCIYKPGFVTCVYMYFDCVRESEYGNLGLTVSF